MFFYTAAGDLRIWDLINIKTHLYPCLNCFVKPLSELYESALNKMYTLIAEPWDVASNSVAVVVTWCEVWRVYMSWHVNKAELPLCMVAVLYWALSCNIWSDRLINFRVYCIIPLAFQKIVNTRSTLWRLYRTCRKGRQTAWTKGPTTSKNKFLSIYVFFLI